MNYKNLLQPRTAKVVQDASFSRRLLSFIIDILVLDLLITAPFTPLFTRIIGMTDLTSVTLSNKEFAAVVVLFLLVYAYYILFEYLLGQSIGMMVMSTRMNGEAGLGRIMLRNSLFLPFFPFIILWVVEPVAILLWRRGVLEKLTATRTVYQRNVII